MGLDLLEQIAWTVELQSAQDTEPARRPIPEQGRHQDVRVDDKPPWPSPAALGSGSTVSLPDALLDGRTEVLDILLRELALREDFVQ